MTGEETTTTALLPVNGATHPPAPSLIALLESLLFVADTPVTATKLAEALDRPVGEVEKGLRELDDLYQTQERGLRLQQRSDEYLMVSMPQAAAAIETFLSLDLTSKLSGPALETLAIVAYRQPATKAQIESVRGVDCGGVLRTLVLRGLIEEVGRLDTVGHPILYGVTDLFMQHFGLLGLEELPPLPEAEADDLWAATELAEEASVMTENE